MGGNLMIIHLAFSTLVILGLIMIITGMVLGVSITRPR
jgi:hypothetical protein